MVVKYKKIFKLKSYTHFDRKKHPRSFMTYIRNAKSVASHGFMPLIYTELKTYKFDGSKVKEKIRPISYSAHIDRYLYEYYAQKINNRYNDYCINNEFNSASIAYRNILHKSNIHFAKEVFTFLAKRDDLYIYCSDFTDYFGCLDHKYLKKKICKISGFHELPTDEYKIYKSITKFSYIELKDILIHYGIRRRYFEKNDFSINKADFNSIKKNI